MVESVVSYKLNENILFDKINFGENFLILYSGISYHQHIFRNFMNKWIDNNSILFYASHKSNKIPFNFEIQEYFFNLLDEAVILNLKSQLDRCFNEVENKNKKIFLIADWSKTKANECEYFFPFLEHLVKKSKGLSPSGWKRRYRDKIQKATPFMFINAMETTKLQNDFLQKIIPFHQRVYLLEENSSLFMLPNLSPSMETIFPKHHILPQQLLEKIVKDNLELIVLLFMENKDKSGYQILKEIIQHFHCILSQGTLYPLLYQLEKENKITKQNGKGREIIYSLTKKTKNELQERKKTLLKAYQHLASFFEGGGGSKKNIKN